MLILYIDVVYFMTIWSILLPFGIFHGKFSPVLVCCTKKNPATLAEAPSVDAILLQKAD
jgi:hypothetical protein